MADPLSMAASITGVATAGVTISMGLYDLAHKIKHAPNQVASLAQELSFLSSLLRSLRSLIRDHAHLCKKRLITDTREILKNVRSVYADIKVLAMDSSSSFYRLKLLFKSSKTKAIMAKVEGFKSTVNLVQNTLQLAILHERKDSKKEKSSQQETDRDIWDQRALLQGLVNANIDSVNRLRKQEQRSGIPDPPMYENLAEEISFTPRRSETTKRLLDIPPILAGDQNLGPTPIAQRLNTPFRASVEDASDDDDAQSNATENDTTAVEVTESDLDLKPHDVKSRSGRSGIDEKMGSNATPSDRDRPGPLLRQHAPSSDQPNAQHPLPDSQPLYKWEEPPNDTATWLYKLVFGDWSKVPLESVSNELQKWEIATPESVYGLVNKWTECPAPTDANSISAAPPPGEELAWKFDLASNTRFLIADQGMSAVDRIEGPDFDPRMAHWDSLTDGSEVELSDPSRGQRNPTRRTSRRHPSKSQRTTPVNPFVSNPFDDNPFLATNSGYPPLPPRYGRGYAYPHIPPPPPPSVVERDANINAIKELLLAQEKARQERIVKKAEAAAEAAKQRAHQMTGYASDKLARLESLILKLVEEQSARDARTAVQEATIEDLKKGLEKKSLELEMAVERAKKKMWEELQIEKATKLEAEDEKRAWEEKLAVEVSHQVRIFSPVAPKWDSSAALRDLQLVPQFKPKEETTSHPQTIHGTLLWSPPAVASKSEMFSLLKDLGWKPLWMRGNSKGETWFLGDQPILINFIHDQYHPQLGPHDNRAGLLPRSSTTEKGFVRVGSELVEDEALQMVNLYPRHTSGPWHEFSLDVTSHDIENLIGMSLLIREHRLRRMARPMLMPSSSTRPFQRSPLPEETNPQGGRKKSPHKHSDGGYLSPEPPEDSEYRRRRHRKNRSQTSSLGEQSSIRSDADDSYATERRRKHG